MESTPQSALHPTAAEILELFRARGDSQYGKESVSQQEHALQAAYFAERAKSAPALIAAALLHDIGHLLHALPDDAPEDGIDDHHEALAARWLERRFAPEVVEPVRLHVAAKRYLCGDDASYFNELSPPSIMSLKLQGGPMAADELRQFRVHPHFATAVKLRRWDDAAKVPNMHTPTLEHYVGIVEGVLNSTGRA